MTTKVKRPGMRTRGAQRAASEQAMLDAFEALLARHGPDGVGVNAVLASAGVGKRLLYEYFGDLKGLAMAWAQRGADPLALGERRPRLQRRLSKLVREARIALILQEFATDLRDHPWVPHLLGQELREPDDLTRALREVRREIGRGYEGLLLEAGAMKDERSMALAFILHAAAQFLALRARFAPDYNGIDLSSPGGWEAAMKQLAVAAAPPARRPPAVRNADEGTEALPRRPGTR
jgi:AcrR family transcriptional regulator